MLIEGFECRRNRSRNDVFFPRYPVTESEINHSVISIAQYVIALQKRNEVVLWAYYQVRQIADCTGARNIGNVFPATVG